MDAALWKLSQDLKTDGYLADFAVPIDRALELLALADTAATPADAASKRQEAVELLQTLHHQLGAAPNGGMLLQAQHIVGSALDMMRSGDGSLTFRRPSDEAKATMEAAALVQALERGGGRPPPAASHPEEAEGVVAGYGREMISEIFDSVTKGAAPDATPAATLPPAAVPGSAPASASTPALASAPEPASAPAFADAPASGASPFGFEEMLRHIAADWKQDKFWRDLAIPIDSALADLAEAHASAEAEAAAALREKARRSLEELNDTLAKAAAQKMFVEEHRVVSKALEAMQGSGGALPPPRTASEEGQAAAMMQSLQVARKARDEAKAKAEAARPYTFTQVVNKPELTVSIRVPPSTKPKALGVSITRSSLKVALAGVTLIDGRLPHPIDVEASGWHLEGQDEGRLLVLDLYKEQAGLEWPGLLLST